MNRCAVIFVTHTMPQVFRVCNELILLDHGKIEFQGSDIALGVSKYFDAFQQGTQAVTGSGEAKVLELTATSNNRHAFLHQTLPLQFGEDVEVTVRLQMDTRFPCGQIQFLFWNTELLPVMDVMTDELLSFPFNVDNNSQAIIRARLPKVNLNAGKYNLSVIVLSSELKVLCRHDGAVAVNVTAHCASGANVILAADWAVCSA